jgi:hypothetical protein
VKVGRGAIVGAGSVITQSVSADALALARGRQTEKPGYAAKFRESKGALAKGTVVRHGDKAFRVTITRPDGTVLPTGPATVRIAPGKRPPQSAVAPAPAPETARGAKSKAPPPQPPAHASNGTASKARKPAKRPADSKKPTPQKGRR